MQQEQFWPLPIKVFPLQWNFSFQWDTFIQTTQNFVPEKCSFNLCICYLYWRDISIQRKGAIFLGPELGHLTAFRRWLGTKIVEKFKSSPDTMQHCFRQQNTNCLTYCTCGNSRTQHHGGKLIMIFIHFLAPWDNDNNQLSRQAHAKMFPTQARRKGKIFYLSPFRGHLLWFRGYLMKGGSTVIIFKISWEGRLLHKKKLVCYKINLVQVHDFICSS